MASLMLGDMFILPRSASGRGFAVFEEKRGALRWGRTCVRLGELAGASSIKYIPLKRERQSFYKICPRLGGLAYVRQQLHLTFTAGRERQRLCCF